MPSLTLTPSCACTSVAMLRDGAVVCGSCSSPVYVSLAVDLTSTTYSTASPASYPPGCSSRRHARDRIRRVPGHERTGDGRATEWAVPVNAYRAHYARASKAPATRPHLALVHDTSDEAAVEAALAASGYRATRAAA